MGRNGFFVLILLNFFTLYKEKVFNWFWFLVFYKLLLLDTQFLALLVSLTRVYYVSCRLSKFFLTITFK